MSDGQQDSPRIAPPGMVVPGVVVLVVWIVGYYATDWDLNTPRPRGGPYLVQSLPEPPGAPGWHSRLWEDRFGKIDLDLNGPRVIKRPEGEKASPDTEPFQGIFEAGGPIAVANDPHAEAHFAGQLHAAEQGGVIQKRLAALEIHRGNRAGPLRLPQILANVRQGHCAALPRAAPHKTMLALEGALVGEQKMQSG